MPTLSYDTQAVLATDKVRFQGQEVAFRRGTARGAVVAIVSDGWDTGRPADLATHMARLSRVAYRVIWVNPRTASPRYRPLVAGMAAALPYCDAVVSAHSLDALDDFTAALSAPRPRR
ncbi:VWA domain-containing protein [Streptomyces sp. NPDC048720]|uniref:VWA domain-containing protein n=1 Tax=Streptomyces sp. NPDC048720 TaxID=3365588 RepID=UPI0037140EFD